MAIANYKSFITRLGKMICKNFTDSEFVKTEFDDEFNSNTAYFTINGYSAWACIYDDDDVITVYVASTHTVEIKIDGTQKDAMATAVRRIESLLDEAEIKKAEIDKKAEEEVNADKQEAEEPQPTPEEADREVTYIDFKPEQDYSEKQPTAENSKVKAVVYSGTDCIIIDCTKYNTETEFIKAIIEKVISASIKEKELFSKATKFFESTDSTDNKVRKLRKEFKQWELLQEREKEADEAYEANYKNKELEKAADEAFEVEYKQYDKIARMIAELINVEVLTAKSMLTNGAERVKKILGL